MGTEEEAAAALKKMREQVSARPSLSRDDVSHTIDERLAFNTALEKFSTEYQDVWMDPVLKKLALDRDTALLTSGDARPYYERYASIGNEIRSWREGLIPKDKKPAVDALDVKEQRKASAPKTPTAASGKVKAPRTEEEVDESPSEVIATMAKQRGGPQWMRN